MNIYLYLQIFYLRYSQNFWSIHINTQGIFYNYIIQKFKANKAYKKNNGIHVNGCWIIKNYQNPKIL